MKWLQRAREQILADWRCDRVSYVTALQRLVDTGYSVTKADALLTEQPTIGHRKNNS